MKLLKNRTVQIILALVVGAAIGALFYPTKNIEERVKKEYEQKIEKISEEKESIRESLSEELRETRQEKTKLQIESSQKITKLTFQVRQLESSKKETVYRLVKPDGTIEEKRYTESEVSETSQVVTQVKEEFNRKVSQIEERWKSAYRDRLIEIKKDFDKKESQYEKTISKLESERKVQVNPKKYGLEIGITSDNEYYGHGNIDVFGPFFLGVHTQTDFFMNHSVGAGIGIRF